MNTCKVRTGGSCCDECAMGMPCVGDVETGQTATTTTNVSYNLRDEFPYNLTQEQRDQLFYPWNSPFYMFRHPRWRRIWLHGMWRYVPWWWMGVTWGSPVLPINWTWMGQPYGAPGPGVPYGYQPPLNYVTWGKPWNYVTWGQPPVVQQPVMTTPTFQQTFPLAMSGLKR